MPESASPVLDTNALQAFGFGRSDGIEILLLGLRTSRLRFPREVYDQDEGDGEHLDDELRSEFARGIRFARRCVRTRPTTEAERYETWLSNASQLARHIRNGTLVIDPLTLEDLPLRQRLMRDYGIGRGEAACLALEHRGPYPAPLVSSDPDVVRPAEDLGIEHVPILDALRAWAKRVRPSAAEVDQVLMGLANARYGLTEEDRTTVFEAARSR